MRGRVVLRFAEDFAPVRITFRARSVLVEDGDSRKPDLVIAGRLPDIVHFATVPTLGGRLHGVPDPRRPHGRRALRRIANRRVRVEGDRTLARRLLRLLGYVLKPSTGLTAREVDQQADAESGRALPHVLAAHVPGGARDVQVHPRLSVYELLEEGARVDRSGLALRRSVREIGRRPLGQFLVLGVEWQPPGQLAGALGRRLDLGGELVVVRDQRRIGGPEGDQHRAGQGGQVHEPVGTELDRVGEGVGQDQAPLGVGVIHLHGLAIQLGDDVAGLDRASARHVLRRGDHRQQVDRHLQLGDRRHGLEDHRSPGHVHLHLVHGLRRLDGDPAAVEGDALADKSECLPIASALVAQHDQLWLLDGPLRDGLQATHALLRDLLSPHDLHADARVLVRDRPGAPGEI